MMEWLFGRRKTPDEILRENKRALDRAVRELEREKNRMETQEQKLIMEIKKNAKNNQMDAVKIMAKDLVRTRHQVKKFNLMKANLQAIALKTLTLKSQNSMAQAMHGVTRGLVQMNRQMNLPQIQRIIHEFEKQTSMIDMKEEMINDVMDDVFEDEGDEEESDQVVTQVLDELGVQLNEKLSGLDMPQTSVAAEAAKKPVKQAADAQPVAADVDAELQERLNNLRQQ